jgi:hypothetical protein
MVASARRQDRDVSGLDGQGTPLEATELHLALTMGDPQNLMNPRMIMDVIVDAVAPGVAPSVLREEALEDGGWVQGAEAHSNRGRRSAANAGGWG